MQRDNQINTTLSLEEQNHLLLQETLKMVRKMHRIYLTQVAITITFVVLPIIGTAFFLPSMIRSFTTTIEQFTSAQQGGATTEDLNNILNQLQGK